MDKLEAYEKSLQPLRQAAANAHGCPADAVTLDMIATQLGYADYAPSTWRKLHSALKQLAQTATPAERTRLLKRLDTLDPPKRAAPGRKRKQLPETDFRQLLQHLNASPGKTPYPKVAAILLTAGLATGLRPAEWATASLRYHPDATLSRLTPKRTVPTRHLIADNHLGDGRLVLEVQTLKQRQETGTRLRYLDVTDISDGTLMAIYQAIAITADAHAHGTLQRLLTQCAKAMLQANHHLWPRRTRHITLTSARHQFMANARRTYGRETTRRLAGHAAHGSGKAYAPRAVAIGTDLAVPAIDIAPAEATSTAMGTLHDTTPDSATGTP